MSCIRIQGHHTILVVITRLLTNHEDPVVRLNGVVHVVLMGPIQCHTIIIMVDHTRLMVHITDLPTPAVILHNICLRGVDMVLVGNKGLHILVHMIITVGKDLKIQVLCPTMLLRTLRQVVSRIMGRCMISQTMIILLCSNLMVDTNRAIHRPVVSTKCSSQVDLMGCKDQPSKDMGLQGQQHLLLMCLTKVHLKQHHRMVQTWLHHNSNMVMHQVLLVSKLTLHTALQHHPMVIMVHRQQQLPQLMNSMVFRQLLVCSKLQVDMGKHLKPVVIAHIPLHSRLMVMPRLRAMETTATALSILAMEVETHQHIPHLLAKPLIPSLHLLRRAMISLQLSQQAMQLLQEQHSEVVVPSNQSV